MTETKKGRCPECGERSLQARWNDYLGWDEGWHFTCENGSCEDYGEELDPGPILEDQPDIDTRKW